MFKKIIFGKVKVEFHGSTFETKDRIVSHWCVMYPGWAKTEEWHLL